MQLPYSKGRERPGCMGEGGRARGKEKAKRAHGSGSIAIGLHSRAQPCLARWPPSIFRCPYIGLIMHGRTNKTVDPPFGLVTKLSMRVSCSLYAGGYASRGRCVWNVIDGWMDRSVWWVAPPLCTPSPRPQGIHLRESSLALSLSLSLVYVCGRSGWVLCLAARLHLHLVVPTGGGWLGSQALSLEPTLFPHWPSLCLSLSLSISRPPSRFSSPPCLGFHGRAAVPSDISRPEA